MRRRIESGRNGSRLSKDTFTSNKRKIVKKCSKFGIMTKCMFMLATKPGIRFSLILY